MLSVVITEGGAGSNVPATMVAVAAFSLHMSAYTAACFYSAINATDAMQVEADARLSALSSRKRE